jgi:hypothetical protein
VRTRPPDERALEQHQRVWLRLDPDLVVARLEQFGAAPALVGAAGSDKAD